MLNFELMTTEEKLQRFKSDLRDLLKNYNACIEWTCSPCSDLHGVYDDHLMISIENKSIDLMENYIDAGNLD